MLAVFARQELEAQKRKEKEDEDNLLKNDYSMETETVNWGNAKTKQVKKTLR